MGDITISKPTNLNGGEAPCGKSACENHEKKNIALRLVYIVQSYGCEDPPKHLGKRTNFPQLPSGNQQLKTSLVWRFPSHV